ncbi:hypothetical protein FJZ18_00435 [Candidatus Pacearchaeota archaeon]|nr:hypothetical protein [Candidatus Pacearchaeota archaeon]
MSKVIGSREEIVARLGHDKYFEAIISGKISTKGQITTDELERILSDIQKVCAQETESYQSTNSQVYIACIELPFGNPRVKFMTTFHNGQLGQNIRDLQVDILEREGLVGARSLEHLLENVFTGCALPRVPALNTKQYKPGPNKPPIQSVPKPSYQVIVDPALVSYLKGHKGYLIAEAFSQISGQKGKALESFDELRSLGVPEKVLNSAANSGFTFSLQSNIDFMKAYRGKIFKIHRNRINSLLANEMVTPCINEFMQSIHLGANYKDAFEYLAQSSNARPAYEFFSNPRHRVEGVEVEEMFDALRFSTLRIVRNDTALETRIRTSLGWWIRVAKAAEVIDKDERMKRVAPFFNKSRGKTSESTTNHVYEGMMALTANMINQSLQYSSNELDFIFEGLWLKGYLPKRGEIENSSGEKNEFRESDRELAGLSTQYGFPIKHLMRRFNKYDAVLWPAFEKLVEERSIKEIDLKSALDDYQLGIKIYDSIPQRVRQSVFTTLKGDEPLAAPDGKRGTMMESLLTYYIGSQRSRFQGAVVNERQHPTK